MAELVATIDAQALKVRELKNAPRPADVTADERKAQVTAAVNELLRLKGEYKAATGNEYVPASAKTPPAPPSAGTKKSKEEKKKEKMSDNGDTGADGTKKKEKNAAVATPIEKVIPKTPVYIPSANLMENFKCIYACKVLNKTLPDLAPDDFDAILAPETPAIVDCSTGMLVFSSNVVCKYLCLDENLPSKLQELLHLDEFELLPALYSLLSAKTPLNEGVDKKISSFASYISNSILAPQAMMSEKDAKTKLQSILSGLEKQADDLTGVALHLLIPTVALGLAYISDSMLCPRLVKIVVAAINNVSVFEASLKEAKAMTSRVAGYDCSTPITSAASIDLDWNTAGLMFSLETLFTAAVGHAFPMSVDMECNDAFIARCGNPVHGDFQCNNAMGLAKIAKGLGSKKYKGPLTPKDIADRIVQAVPSNPLIESMTPAPNGFINIRISTTTITEAIASVIRSGINAPVVEKKQVLVDFSSPNIAKEMHVGHLRSTIIGDCICKVLEFCGHDVMRINHVGDWGTQFGMLIANLKYSYPDICTNTPNITDLTKIYKASKKLFDEDAVLDMYAPLGFKEVSRNHVVKLQAGDAECRKIWSLLCEASRVEFDKVYDILGVKLKETGESFYNPMIPGVIEELQGLGIVKDDNGMLIIMLPHFTIPLILRKSDGGYGYDSTDMAALKYRLFDLKRDWIIYVTDEGQSGHFHMCFDAAKASQWVNGHRLDHIGFGVVCGDDGKRFRTRGSDTVRLIDLLNESKVRMYDSLKTRVNEGKSSLTDAEIETCSRAIGYGAVKYFDLKQSPATNYIFNYDRMLDTKGDTAVYLLFAYARVASILRKAKDERNIDVSALYAKAHGGMIIMQHNTERALAFELLQFGDTLKYVLKNLSPSKVCDFLKDVCVKVTDFVTQCHVLNATDVANEADREMRVHSRLLLCEATRRVMAKCFALLGIEPLERI